MYVGQIYNKLPSCFPKAEQIALAIALAILISLWKALGQSILNFPPACVIISTNKNIQIWTQVIQDLNTKKLEMSY